MIHPFKGRWLTFVGGRPSDRPPECTPARDLRIACPQQRQLSEIYLGYALISRRTAPPDGRPATRRSAPFQADAPMKWPHHPNLRKKPPALSKGRGPVQVRIRRAFIASGTEVLSSSAIYDWTHARRRRGRRKSMPYGIYSQTLRTLRTMCDPVARGSIVSGRPWLWRLREKLLKFRKKRVTTSRGINAAGCATYTPDNNREAALGPLNPPWNIGRVGLGLLRGNDVPASSATSQGETSSPKRRQRYALGTRSRSMSYMPAAIRAASARQLLSSMAMTPETRTGA
jgi:hypothetical protein